MHSIEKKPNSLVVALNRLLNEAKGKSVTVKTILGVLAGRGQAVLLVVFSLPFCLPIQIPGFSTPFGILLAFIGLRIAFGRRAWLPKKLLSYSVSYHTLEKASALTIKLTQKLRFLTSTRLTWIVLARPLHIAHGITIFLLSLLLALPLPIPFSNLLVALPLVAFGLGLLEDDGLLVIVAYILVSLTILFFSSLFLFGSSLAAGVF